MKDDGVDHFDPTLYDRIVVSGNSYRQDFSEVCIQFHGLHWRGRWWRARPVGKRANISFYVSWWHFNWIKTVPLERHPVWRLYLLCSEVRLHSIKTFPYTSFWVDIQYFWNAIKISPLGIHPMYTIEFHWQSRKYALFVHCSYWTKEIILLPFVAATNITNKFHWPTNKEELGFPSQSLYHDGHMHLLPVFQSGTHKKEIRWSRSATSTW